MYNNEKSYRILIIDDESNIRQALQMGLRNIVSSRCSMILRTYTQQPNFSSNVARKLDEQVNNE